MVSSVGLLGLNRVACLLASAVVAAGALAGCTAFPSQGPNSALIQGDEVSTDQRLGYLLVNLDRSNIAELERRGPKALGEDFRGFGGAATALVFGVGDLVNVTIFEAASGGLFIPSEAGSRAGNFVALPVQEVDRNGMIQVPFAGYIQTAGRTPGQVKASIEAALRNRAIEPQAIVSLQESRSTLVTVTGEANAPARFALARSTDRVLDAITRAGGSKWPTYETYVTLQRGSRTAKVYYNRLLREPSTNIFLRPNDVLSLSRETRSFMALGASGQNGFINFEAETLTLSQAVGRSGGVLDARGDPGQVFVYRLEDRRVIESIRPDQQQRDGAQIPTIYHVNLRDPEGYFLASKFPMHDRDVLFVSNAQSVEISKVLQFIQLATNTVTDSEAARIAVKGSR
jgi:polysaccharide export outer membrane protein